MAFLSVRVIVLGNLQCQGVLLVCIIVKQRPTVLIVGMGGLRLLGYFFSPVISLFFSLYLEDGPI